MSNWTNTTAVALKRAHCSPRDPLPNTSSSHTHQGLLRKCSPLASVLPPSLLDIPVLSPRRAPPLLLLPSGAFDPISVHMWIFVTPQSHLCRGHCNHFLCIKRACLGLFLCSLVYCLLPVENKLLSHICP